MKRGGGDDSGPSSKRQRPGERYVFKVLCPETLVSTILGPNGITVAHIQDTTSCHLNFSRRGEFFPTCRLRILNVSGPSPEDVLAALDLVLDKVLQCAEDERKGMEKDGTYGEQDGDFVEASGDYRLCVAVTDVASTGVDGTGLTQMQEDIGVRLFVDEEDFERHKLLVLAGTREQLQAALDYLNNLVQGCVDEDWFGAWTRTMSFAASHRGEDKNSFKQRPQRAEGRGQNHERCTLFIGSLATSTDNHSLRSHFSKYGDIVEVDVRKDKSNRTKGFGFVTYSHESAAEAAVSDTKNHHVDGKWIDVKRYGDRYSGNHSTGKAASSARQEYSHDDGRRGHESRQSSSTYNDRYSNYSNDHHYSSDSRRDGRGYENQGSRDHRREPEVPSASRSTSSNIRWFSGLAEKITPAYMDLDYSISCTLPGALCGPLIGRKGENVHEVERKTGAKVQLTKRVEGSDDRTLSVVGPMLSVYAAHMLLMQLYNEAANRKEEPPPKDNFANRKIEELQRQIQSLKQQMGGSGGRR
jgi:hypothetical protein